jgi:hypothetical protein
MSRRVGGLCRRRSALATICAVIATGVLWLPAIAEAAGTGGIKGEVVGPGSAPLAEVWVCTHRILGDVIESNCDFTGSSGTYSISGLNAGAYKVEFWPESTAPSYVGEYYDDKPFWDEADEINVAEGVTVTGIDAELAEAATIEGEVRAASVSDPLDVLICAQLPSGRPEGCTFTDPDGTYSLPGLPAGEYKVQFIPAAFSYNLLNQFYDHESTWADADLLAVAPGATKTGIDADLEPGAEIRGTVYSAVTGAPLPEVPVCALFVEEGGEDWQLRECLPTSSTGSYALLSLSTDLYKVVFSPDFKELFGEEEFEEDDGFLTQYFDHKATLAAADSLSLAAPEIKTKVDAQLQSKVGLRPAPPAPTPTAQPSILPRKHRKHCRPGFRRKKVAGKRRCVKAHKHRRHRHHR